MAIIDRVRELITPIVEAESVEIYDIDHDGGVLRVYVDHQDGVDIEVIKRISRGISNMIDEVDPIPGRFTLEVSSPGLERPLRTPDHFRRAVGSEVKIKTRPEANGERRLQGVLTAADDDGVDVTTGEQVRRVAYDDVAKARTVFEWGPTPKKGGKRPDPKFPEKKAPTS